SAAAAGIISTRKYLQPPLRRAGCNQHRVADGGVGHTAGTRSSIGKKTPATSHYASSSPTDKTWKAGEGAERDTESMSSPVIMAQRLQQ
ncbi:unnamed protein product, partial [Ectocarpus sp. 12 AP-2014]